MIDMKYDEAHGILRFTSRGMTSPAEVEAFDRKAESLLDRARARRGHCLFLVDAADTVVHPKETAAHFADIAARRFRPGDRTAILIASAVAKLQSQRMTTKEATAYFASEPDALAWLLAEA